MFIAFSHYLCDRMRVTEILPRDTVVRACKQMHEEPCYECTNCYDSMIIDAVVYVDDQPNHDIFERAALKVINSIELDQQVEIILGNFNKGMGTDIESAWDNATSWLKNKQPNYNETINSPHTYILGVESERIVMPDGTDGLICIKCGEYNSYVNPNHGPFFICPKHRM